MKKGKEDPKQNPKQHVEEGRTKDAATARDTNTAQAPNQPEQEKVWDEEGGSPPEQISSTKAVKPRIDSKAGSMGPAKN